VGHGQWLPWLQAHEDDLGFGERAAQWLMRGAKWLAANPQLLRNLDESTALVISRRFWGNVTIRGTLGTGDNQVYAGAIHRAGAPSARRDRSRPGHHQGGQSGRQGRPHLHQAG
jgi:hypothetical protein